MCWAGGPVTPLLGFVAGACFGPALVAYLFGVNEPPLIALGQPAFPDPTGGESAQLFATMLKIGAVLNGSGLRIVGVAAR
uniref:Uncharacterized protein n=1 Tax=Mycobacterium riyadhense TaxID=486698 RepID=A0A653ED62_9MYCO|nr:hypothetical protein BIN_B_00876 [Mycobacterium riyadhense]